MMSSVGKRGVSSVACDSGKKALAARIAMFGAPRVFGAPMFGAPTAASPFGGAPAAATLGAATFGAAPIIRVTGCGGRGSGCEGVYRASERMHHGMPIYQQEGSSGILYYDGSEWKLNNNDSTGGWYYNNGSNSIIGGSWQPAAGASGNPTVEEIRGQGGPQHKEASEQPAEDFVGSMLNYAGESQRALDEIFGDLLSDELPAAPAANAAAAPPKAKAKAKAAEEEEEEAAKGSTDAESDALLLPPVPPPLSTREWAYCLCLLDPRGKAAPLKLAPALLADAVADRPRPGRAVAWTAYDVLTERRLERLALAQATKARLAKALLATDPNRPDALEGGAVEAPWRPAPSPFIIGAEALNAINACRTDAPPPEAMPAIAEAAAAMVLGARLRTAPLLPVHVSCFPRPVFAFVTSSTTWTYDAGSVVCDRRSNSDATQW